MQFQGKKEKAKRIEKETGGASLRLNVHLGRGHRLHLGHRLCCRHHSLSFRLELVDEGVHVLGLASQLHGTVWTWCLHGGRPALLENEGIVLLVIYGQLSASFISLTYLFSKHNFLSIYIANIFQNSCNSCRKKELKSCPSNFHTCVVAVIGSDGVKPPDPPPKPPDMPKPPLFPPEKPGDLIPLLFSS